ncbi:hypothetical protein GCM10007161_06240 [Ignatzschineria indica]|uniref:Fimbrial-type adhesion domain-containing protein n=1 Tax=Ignatzschineria indica TaxID=472583 RepID=A0A2U2AN75_9GAMM|nr:fimbrial protein [Ignatzschineria indica]PWD84597.1 hypothetical protein DC082_03435 [Ignatzschineria indica]GGZ77741.1 hypothetical protein GCM10007161_06240 [Ignatzschineria indica]
MKKLSLALVATLSLSTTAFAQDLPKATAGSDGQIKFTGTVTEKGCTIVAGNSATIDLGSIAKGTLQKQKFGAWGTGEIKFVDCNLDVDDKDKLKAVTITIQPGKEATFGTNLWANNGNAQGVGIEVEVGGSKGLAQIPPTGTPDPIEANIDAVNGTATYSIRGRMAGDTTVTAGSVETTISFVASYK